MSFAVFTGADFTRQLPSIAQRHPTATTLHLQLHPVCLSDRGGEHGTKDAAAKGASHVRSVPLSQELIQTDWHDGTADLLTLYAVFSHTSEEERGRTTVSAEAASGGDNVAAAASPKVQNTRNEISSQTIRQLDSCVVAVYAVVTHTSHITLNWCGQLQRSLSVLSLLLSGAEHVDDEDTDSSSSLSEEDARPAPAFTTESYEKAGASEGITSFVVCLTPFVPPLQWHRAVDGVLGSHHWVCASHAVSLSGLVMSKGRGEEAEVAVAAASAHDQRSTLIGDDFGDAVALYPPQQKARGEEAENAHPVEAAGHAEKAALSSPSFVLSPAVALPFRVGAVLNGTVPIPANGGAGEEKQRVTCVLCLFARAGALLTFDNAAAVLGALPPPSASSVRRPIDLLQSLSAFVVSEVIPSVSLDVLRGAWLCDVSGDLCKVRRRLGPSFGICYPSLTHSSAHPPVRSLVFVLDFSAAMMKVLLNLQAVEDFQKNTSSTKEAMQLRSCMARQIASAMQDMLGRLVSANIDVCTFSAPRREDANLIRAGLAAESDVNSSSSNLPSQRRLLASPLTREVLCRSIADSIQRIVSLSPHAAFKAEVQRLLSDTDQEGEAESYTAENAEDRIGSERPTRGDEVRRQMEKRLLAASLPRS